MSFVSTVSSTRSDRKLLQKQFKIQIDLTDNPNIDVLFSLVFLIIFVSAEKIIPSQK